MKGRFIGRWIAVGIVCAYLCAAIGPIKTTVKAENYVEAKAECVMEVHSRRILYASNSNARMPMASTTKILTAITVLEERQNLQETLVIPEAAAGVEGSSVYLKAGDEYTVEELLYGLMLRSGNDCATALALHCSNTVADFAAKMNETAQKSGALNSRFENPHGLPCENHYTTARDLTLITCYAMQNPVFRQIVSTSYYQPRKWKNKNKMLALYEGGIGVKTGYTKAAGRCLVSAAKRENMMLVCTVLNCPTTYERSKKLLDDAFGAYDNELLLGANEPITLENTTCRAVTGKDYYYPILPEERELVNIQTKSTVSSPERKKSGEIVGQFQIYLAKQLLFSGNLYKL